MSRNLINVNDSCFITEEDYIKTKEDALQMIIDLGFDYDGYCDAKDLKTLIDELVGIARIGLNRI